MALFIIERNWAEDLDPSEASINAIKQINADCGVKWLTSFLSADKRKTYCLYEATNPDDLREAANRASIPADAIIELDGEIGPDMFN